MLNQRPRVTQSGEAAAKDLTADLKLTRYPRSLAATLAAFPSVSLFPQVGSLITRIWIGQNASTASCTACPPVCGKCWTRERFRSWECPARSSFAQRCGRGEASSHRFSINGLLSQKRREDARTRRAGSAHSKSPATAGRNTTRENLRKLATASSSCGELRRFSSIVVRVSRILCLSFRAKSRNLSILFPILPLGHSRTITAAWPLLFRGLRSPTPCP